MLHENKKIEVLYQYIADEEDARVCKDISESACRVVPGNFFTLLMANSLSKLGDELCNAKTILPWLLSFVQAPQFFVGLLVPVRESGSLLPQLVIAAFVRRLAVRKWVWVLGSAVQSLSVIAILAVSINFTGTFAGIGIVTALIVFSLARGLCSVAHKDVIGKTVPKTRRGRLGGLAGSVAGAITIVVGLFFASANLLHLEVTAVALVLLGAAMCWAIACAVFATIKEEPGATEGGGNALEQALASFSLLATDKQFRQFVLVRSLLLCSALIAPFMIQLANQGGAASLSSLGFFVVASGLASIISSPYWGRFADVSSKKVMIFAASIASILGLSVFILSQYLPLLTNNPVTYPLAFLILGIAHNGVRLGRKTYLVDMASGNKRTEYVAVSNTVIGAVLLAAGVFTGIISTYSTSIAILILSLAGALGALLALRLKEV